MFSSRELPVCFTIQAFKEAATQVRKMFMSSFRNKQIYLISKTKDVYSFAAFILKDANRKKPFYHINTE